METASIRPEREDYSGAVGSNIEAQTTSHVYGQPFAHGHVPFLRHRQSSSEPSVPLNVVVYLQSRIAGRSIARRAQSGILFRADAEASKRVRERERGFMIKRARVRVRETSALWS